MNPKFMHCAYYLKQLTAREDVAFAQSYRQYNSKQLA